MTNLDPETKARIEQEEAYRAQLRAQQSSAAGAAASDAAVPPAKPPKKKLGCGAIIGYAILAVVVLSVIGQLMGSSDSDAGNSLGSTPATSSAGAVADAPPAETTGDAIQNSDGSMDVGVWRFSDIRWDTAKNVGGEYGTSADSGETFVIVNFTLMNNTSDTQSYSSMIDQPQVILADGGTIDADTMLSIEAVDQMIDGQIAPGLKRAGGYAFRVPTASLSGMKFQLQFFNGKRLVVDLTQ